MAFPEQKVTTFCIFEYVDLNIRFFLCVGVCAQICALLSDLASLANLSLLDSY